MLRQKLKISLLPHYTNSSPSASMDTQDVYGHTVDGEAKKTAELIDQAFNKVLDSEKPKE